MNRPSNTGFILIFVVALAAAALALRPTTTETEVLPPVTLPDPGEDPTNAAVAGLRQSGGFSLLGLAFGDVTHTAVVQLSAPTGCYELVTTGDPWPAPFKQCDMPFAIEGTVSGGGIAVTGESIIAVDVTVTEACYITIAPGDPWPTATDACA